MSALFPPLDQACLLLVSVRAPALVYAGPDYLRKTLGGMEDVLGHRLAGRSDR